MVVAALNLHHNYHHHHHNNCHHHSHVHDNHHNHHHNYHHHHSHVHDNHHNHHNYHHGQGLSPYFVIFDRHEGMVHCTLGSAFGLKKRSGSAYAGWRSGSIRRQ